MIVRRADELLFRQSQMRSNVQGQGAASTHVPIPALIFVPDHLGGGVYCIV